MHFQLICLEQPMGCNVIQSFMKTVFSDSVSRRDSEEKERE